MASHNKTTREEVACSPPIMDAEGNKYFKKERKIFNKAHKPSLFNLWPEPDEVIEEFWVERPDGKIEKIEPYGVEFPSIQILFTEKHVVKDKEAIDRDNEIDRYKHGGTRRDWVYLPAIFTFLVIAIFIQIMDFIFK